MRYYHVTGPDYNEGEHIYCYDRLVEMGCAPAWKWEEAEDGFDGDVVCLFDNLDDAKEFKHDYQPNGQILAIDVEPDEYGIDETGLYSPEGNRIKIVTVSEGYYAVYGHIPGDAVTLLTEEDTCS